MSPKTQYELSAFLMNRAHKQLMSDLKKLSALLDTMIDDAERSRDSLATALHNEAADAGAIKEDTTPIEEGRCEECTEAGSWCKCHLKYK